MIFNLIRPLTSTSTTIAFAVVTYPAGATCTATLGTTVLTATDTSGYMVFHLNAIGRWTITATDGTSTVSDTVRITAKAQRFTVTLSFRVPTAYREVEYLESTGTQYINTGFLFQNDLSKRINIKFALLDDLTHSVGGTYDTEIGTASILGFPAYLVNNGLYYNVAAGSYALSSATVGGVMTTVFNDSSHAVIENGTTKTTITTYAYTCTRPFYLFGINQDGYLAYSGKTRIYYFQFIDNTTGTLLADYIPVYRKADTVPGFWDTVSETFITNAGTGTFNRGPIVS